MNARAVNSAAGVILAAIEQGRVPAGIATALDAAGLLNSPERATEFADAAATVARLVLERGEHMKVEHALRDRIAELEAGLTTVYRAEHPDAGITLGHYGTAAAARAHCEATERRTWATFENPSFSWLEDDEQPVAEMTAWVDGEKCTTGYIVTALELDTEYDEEADE